MKFLCGDIGGTKTRIAIIEYLASGIHINHETDLASGEFDRFEDLIRTFAPTPSSIDAACFGVAGPVEGRTARVTNLPWQLDAAAIASEMKVNDCWLLNDLEATAWGIPALREKDFLALQEGTDGATGNACVIAAGTGLGEAGIYRERTGWRPFATEGGHTDFAPANTEEEALRQYLGARYGHVSWERLVSGMGIVDLYGFLRAGREQRFPDHSTAVAVAEAAAQGCPLADRALNWFVELYGREAGNLALKMLARGGVFIGGGIAPKQLPRLRSGAFIRAFLDKGRMRPLLEAMPVKVILDDHAALLGTGRYACWQMTGQNECNA